jgi:PAS domain S-box-containing protein
MCSGFSMSYKKQGKCLTRLGAIAKVASRRRAGPLWERAFRAITVNSDSQLNSRNFDFLAGGGEMGERMRALDWRKTPLGAAGEWPQSLKTIVRVMLDSRYAMWMLWGPQLTFFCNDAYLPTVGIKRDWVLGARSDKVWEEIWPDIGPRIQRVLVEGRATWDEGLPLVLERSGFREETYHTFSYSPIYDDHSRIAGMLCVVTEVTERVIGERRLRVLRDLAASPRAEATEEACKRLIDVLSNYPLDVTFASLYLLDQTQERLNLAHHCGILPEQLIPAQIALADRPGLWTMREAIESGVPQIAELPQGGLESSAVGPWPDRIHQAMILPVKQGSLTSTAVLIAGLSPLRPLDDGYRGFLDLIVRQFAAAIADAQAYEAERARSEALAEIDRAKTAFFSNVSHEFRTPLTLLLGPLEEALQKPAVGLSGEALDSAHRNALRLLRLVNTLLDFSRIEAGRAQAHYVPTDLAAATLELAGVFRSAMDRARLRYSVACNALPEPVFIDREMWEKIVLNLVSNAFKYTLDGEIRVQVQTSKAGAELVVADTGTGIPAEALPQLFNRFYRVPGASGRTHEGSGIGLSLVRELVRLHGGSIEVESHVGRGSIFRVSIPFGAAHLPHAQVAQKDDRLASVAGAQAFVEEAQRWLPDPANLESGDFLALARPDSLSGTIDSINKPAVLLVDDNRDMREYVVRLLQPRFVVSAVADGQSALDLIDSGVRPDLVLSDVMMPRLDGFGLLKALRARPLTESTPVIFLSARAGEEARIEGIDVGADDYLIKPFSARELISRIETHIRLSRLRRSASEHIKMSEERLRIAIDEAGMGTWNLDLKTQELRWSRSHYTLLGFEPDESNLATYEMWRSRIHPADLEMVEAAIAQSRDAQTLYSQEYRIIRADTGAVRWLRVLGRFLYDESAIPTRSVGVAFDDTDRKVAEIALREADQRKDVFLATLAHELRNPLAPIRNAAQLLGSPKLGPEQLQWVQSVIQRQVKHLAWLLDDLLDVARITQGKLELKRQLISLKSVVDSAVEVARPLLDSKGHHLAVSLPAEPVTLYADPLRLSQVLSNLLTNAAKYTGAGGHIALAGHIEKGTLSISIKDDGIGIPDESLGGIFAMFSQVEGAAVHSEGGLGIGLALVSGLTELHGGTAEAKSEGLGHGSEFVVRLPVVTADASVATPTADADVSAPIGRRVLIADDNRDAADSLAMFLEMAGHDVRVVHDGRSALSVAQAFRPDTALLDIGMPQLNGYEVAQALRQEPWGASIALIALTGWGQEDDRKRAIDAGFDRHLTKPVDPDMLVSLIASPRATDKGERAERRRL